MTKYIFLALAALVAISACGEDHRKPKSASSVGIGYEVEELFTHNGCTVYRFSDKGYHRYFTNCSGATTWNESCGKGCTHEMGVN